MKSVAALRDLSYQVKYGLTVQVVVARLGDLCLFWDSKYSEWPMAHTVQ